MWIKNYTAPSVREALSKIRQEMGANAMILDTRVENGITNRSSGPGSRVTVTAAMEKPDEKSAEVRSVETRAPDGPKTLTVKGALVGENDTPDDDNVEMVEKADATVIQDQIKPEPNPEIVTRLSGIETRIDDLAATLQRGNGASRFSRWLNAPEVNRWLYKENRLKAELAEAYTGFLLDQIPEPDPFLTREQLPTTVSFVGPPASGRSTAMMKTMAAWWRNHQSPLPIIEITSEHRPASGRLAAWSETFDFTHRRFTFEQPKELAAYLNDVEARTVFVRCDLPSVEDGGERRLKKILKTINARLVVMVLSAIVRREMNDHFLTRYRKLGPTHLLLTHFDLSQSFDDARHLSATARLPLSYYTMGRAPFDQIEAFANNSIRVGIATEVGAAIRQHEPAENTK